MRGAIVGTGRGVPEKKLTNANFLALANPNVVPRERERLDEAREKDADILESLDRL